MLFGIAVRATVHICWDPGCQAGRPGNQDPSKDGGEMTALGPPRIQDTSKDGGEKTAPGFYYPSNRLAEVDYRL